MAIDKTLKLTATILIVAALAIAVITMAVITINQNVSTTGTITAGPNVGVFSNSACTTSLSSMNWGSIEAGGSATQTIYVEDTGGAAMTPSISVSNWSPSTASSYITITWSTLPSSISTGVSNAVAVTLTLTVSGSITGISSFSNTITISGTG